MAVKAKTWHKVLERLGAIICAIGVFLALLGRLTTWLTVVGLAVAILGSIIGLVGYIAAWRAEWRKNIAR
jgi:disulfide bond formation protein DsbB